MTNVNDKTPRPVSLSWTYDPVAKKDLNAQQWGFKVIKNKGKPDAMIARSMTELDAAFTNTPYNLKNCKVGYSRYGAIKAMLMNIKEKIAEPISTIFISLDAVYVNDKMYGGAYATRLADPTEMLNYYIVESKALERIIKDSFSKQKQISATEQAMLMSYVKAYVNSRTHMLRLDTTKLIIELLKDTELSFSGMTTLVFLDNSTELTLDFKKQINTLSMSMRASTGIELPVIELPSVEAEINGVVNFVHNLTRQGTANINVNVYKAPIARVTADIAKNYMLGTQDVQNQLQAQYKRPLNPQEKADIDARIANLNKVRNGGTPASEEKCKEFVRGYLILKDIVTRVNRLVSQGLGYNANANNIEQGIWCKYLSLSTVQGYMDAEFNFKRANGKKVVDKDNIPSLKAIQEVVETHKSILGIEPISANDVALFKKVSPTFMRDDRGTVESRNLGLMTDSVQQTIKEVQQLCVNVFDILEVFLGIQYGILSAFMGRFGERGLKVQGNFLSNLRTQPFKYSDNILAVAERVLYQNLGASLDAAHEDYYRSDIGELIIGSNKGFVKKVIDHFNSNFSDTEAKLTHTDDNGNGAKDRITNLVTLLGFTEYIYEQYANYFAPILKDN